MCVCAPAQMHAHTHLDFFCKAALFKCHLALGFDPSNSLRITHSELGANAKGSFFGLYSTKLLISELELCFICLPFLIFFFLKITTNLIL